MRKLLFLAIIVLMSTANSKKVKPLENALLWEISKKGSDNKSYLYGTIHLSCTSELSDNVNNALESSEKVFLEIKMDDPELQNKVMANVFMKDSSSLLNLLTPEKYAVVDTFFQKNMNMSAVQLDKIKPIFSQTMLMPLFVSCTNAQAIDAMVMNKAKENGLEIFGLETIEDQLAVFDEISYQEQADMLYDLAVMGIDSVKVLFDDMSAVYDNKEINKFQTMMKDKRYMSFSNDKFTDALLKDRNEKWMTTIMSEMSNQSTFFAVGSGHLAGEYGVLRLLQQQGYKVKPVK